MNPYDDTDDEIVRTHGRVHANGEQTHVAIMSCGERHYVAVAYDIRPADFTPIAAQAVAYDPTIEGATQRAENWMENNPKGVAPGEDSDDSSGVLRTLKGAGQKLNDYGNTLAEKQQQEQQGGEQQ